MGRTHSTLCLARTGRGTVLVDAAGDSEENAQVLLLMKKRKKEFDHMTSNVLKEKLKHKLASLHFKKIYDHLLFIPSIFITLVSGILAVIAQSNLATDSLQEGCTLVIAVLASFSVFWQSLIKQLDYGGRASLHHSAAMALTKIYKLAILKAGEDSMIYLNDTGINGLGSASTVKPLVDARVGKAAHQREYNDKMVSFDEEAGGGVQDDSDEAGDNQNRANDSKPEGEKNGTQAKTDQDPVVDRDADGENHFSLTKQFEQATQGCTSAIPIRIVAAFDTLDSRINVCNKQLLPSESEKKNKIAWEKVYPALYHQLTLTIIGSPMWPYRVPDAEKVVTKAIKDFQSLINKENGGADVLSGLIERSREINQAYDNDGSA
eukprot:CAMPEP_0183706880 /NCGR_PEP_ID=MMETSP0737-20130205/3596_1 /TAXON_ID=385413 /ORGANISM="Thalassiosira miniscula, Strain CCMP1093" /LENGTH=376 /DNA_ID=CAMNT_0025934409 /DNA_START=205 /DNA_END=1335 /DNA_ORIENTATION=+